jgi:signal transduction histidine kinase
MSGVTNGSAGTDPSSVESQALTTVKNALTQLVGVVRADAGKASDPGLAKALNDSADALNTEINKVNSISDLDTLSNDMQGMTALDKYCPDALSE